jgi:hypothetical protein
MACKMKLSFYSIPLPVSTIDGNDVQWVANWDEVEDEESIHLHIVHLVLNECGIVTYTHHDVIT